MWQTAEQAGLSTEQVFKICEKLWKEEMKSSKGKCPDCAVRVGQVHDDGCDVARCLDCNGQLLSCGCKNGTSDVWTGMWPGIKGCYEKKLISRFGTKGEWSFDLNTEAVLSMREKKKK